MRGFTEAHRKNKGEKMFAQQRNLLIAGLILAGLFLLGGSVAAAVTDGGTQQRAGSGQGAAGVPARGANPAAHSGAETPLAFPCGNVWTTQAAYPITVSSAAVTSLNGMLYSFGGTSGSAN